jgi:hypothetical protein
MTSDDESSDSNERDERAATTRVINDRDDEP